MIDIQTIDCMCERGNTWLTNENRHYFVGFVGNVEENKWIEISIMPDNYPAFNVFIVEKTETEIVAHINDRFQGWEIHKANLPIQRNENGRVLVSD